MAGISIDGLISGLNTKEIIDALMFSQRAPAIRLATRRDATTGKLNAVNGLNASVLGVRVAADALSKTDTFRSRSATSTNASLVTATATSASEPGSFSVSVQQLASALQVSSDPGNVFDTATEALGLEGQLRVNNSTIAIRTTDTLRDIAARLSNSGAGVAASTIEVESGKFRLSVRSLQSGADGFTIANAGSTNILEGLRLVQAGSDTIANPITDGAASSTFNVHVLPVAGLLNLSTNVPSGTVSIGNGAGSINVSIDLATQSLDDIASAINTAASSAGSAINAHVEEVSQGVFQLEIESGDATTPTFTDAGNVLETLGVVRSAFTQVDQAGEDSQFKVNGIDIVRSSNTISDVVSGVTFTLVSDGSPVETTTISVQSETKAAVDAVEAFVKAYNTTRGYVSTFASYDPDTQRAGVLLGDSSVLSVESGLSSALSRSISTLPSQQLGALNSGTGAAAGSIQVTDKTGNTATIDLSSAKTVQDVMDLLNRNSTIDVEATINRAGTGINIRDTSGGQGILSIAESGGGTTAADLGILGSTASGLLAGGQIAQAEFLSLGQLGVTVNVDGTLAFDSTKFRDYLEDHPDAVQAFFTQANGFGRSTRSSIDLLTDSTKGVLAERAKSLQSTIDSYGESIKSIEDRLVLVEQRLKRQFSELEKSLAQMQQQASYVSSQLGQLSTGSSGTNN